VPTTTHDVYDVAHLSGGLTRVVDTAVVALLERGRLKVDGAGRLHAVGSAVHPVEAAVLALAGPRPRRMISSLRIRAQEDQRLTGVGAGLVARGLLRRNPFAGLSSGWPAHLRTAAGRRVLQEWPAATAGSAADVALGGPERMTDRVLRETVFGVAPVPPPAGQGRRRGVAGDASGSWWLYGSGVGWGGDCGSGGGFGGDGGGGGGGDGGGGC
jgi:hypothetical protein